MLVEHLLLAFNSDERFGQVFFKTLQIGEEALREAVCVIKPVTDESKYLCCLHFCG